MIDETRTQMQKSKTQITNQILNLRSSSSAIAQLPRWRPRSPPLLLVFISIGIKHFTFFPILKFSLLLLRTDHEIAESDGAFTAADDALLNVRDANNGSGDMVDGFDEEIEALAAGTVDEREGGGRGG